MGIRMNGRTLISYFVIFYPGHDNGRRSKENLYPHRMIRMKQGVAMEDILQRLKGPAVQVRPMDGDTSPFVKPKSVLYSLDGE